MNSYRTLRGDLLEYIKNRPNNPVSSAPVKREPDPVGWTTRERFGIRMRYWPRLSERLDFDASSKAAIGIPRKYMKFYIDEIEPKDIYQAQVMNLMNVMYSVKSSPLLSLVVMGGNGSGKTLLGSSLVNTLMRLGNAIDHNTGLAEDWSPYFCNEADLFNKIEGYSRNGVDWFFELTENCRLLVIDEFGMTQWTPTDKRRMEQLLNKRFGNGLRTIILTNLSAERFSELLSDQLRSRFRTGRSIQMSSPDYREKFVEEDDFDDPF